MNTPPPTDAEAAAAREEPVPPSASARWMEFLVGDTVALPLRAFEVLFTASFLLWMADSFLTWREWLTEAGFHLNAAELRSIGYPPPLPLLSGAGVLALGVVTGVAGLAHVFDVLRRPALLMLFAIAIYVQGADPIRAGMVNKLFVGVYAVLLFSPGYERVNAGGGLQVSAVAIRLVQATLLLLYLASGIAKAFKGDWLLHDDVLYTHVQGVYRTDFAAWLLRTLPVWSWTVMQWMTLLFELEAPVLFCARKLRSYAVVFGLGFHLMIALLMKDLILYSAVMWSFYALFLSVEEWRALGAWVRRRLRWT